MTRGWHGLVVLLVIVLPGQVEAATPAPEQLEVARATVSPDRGIITTDVRCNARRRGACTGTLVATSLLDEPVSAARQVRLVRGKLRRLELRLRADGLARIAEAFDEPGGGEVHLGTGGRTLSAQVTFEPRLTCNSGQTAAVGTSGERAFRVQAFGVFLCAPPAFRPVPVDASSPTAVGEVKLAGRYLAYTHAVGGKCIVGRVLLLDLATGTALRTVNTSTVRDGSANGCEGSGFAKRLVLRASGNVAWTEAPGDDGIAVVRTMGPEGDVRQLDQGANLDPLSLRSLDASTIAWTRAGAQQTAELR